MSRDKLCKVLCISHKQQLCGIQSLLTAVSITSSYHFTTLKIPRHKKRAGRCLVAGFYMVLLSYCDIIHSLFHRSRCISNEWSLKTFRHLSKLCYVSGRKPPSTLLRCSLVIPSCPSCGVPSFGTCLRRTLAPSLPLSATESRNVMTLGRGGSCYYRCSIVGSIGIGSSYRDDSL